jgi:penicillin-binding protein 2
MMKKSNRLFILGTIIFLLFVFFSYQLARLQLVEGKKYLEQAERLTTSTKSIEAARGEILDCYGRKLASNRVAYSVVLERNLLSDSMINHTIEKLIEVFEENGGEWYDTMPITENEPYKFTDNDFAVKRMQKKLNLNHYATVENCIDEMNEEFELQDYSGMLKRKIMGVRYEMLKNDYFATNNYTFADDVSSEIVAIIEENNFLFQGVDIRVIAERKYMKGTAVSHLLGVVGPIYQEEYDELKKKGYAMNDEIGKSGIEKAYEDELRGTDGVLAVEKNPSGEIVKETVAEEPHNGNSVMLSIDSKFQQKCQDILEKYIKIQQNERWNGTGYDACAGVAVVANVKTGAIIAAANYPSYDIETYLKDYDSLLKDKNTPLFNRAINGTYRPGSTFKPAVAIAGLATGTITGESGVNCQKYYKYYEDHTYTCLEYHGYLNVVGGLRESCNIFFYDVGRRVGINTLNKYCKSLGLGQPTGIELPEAAGILDGYNYRLEKGLKWYVGDVVQCSIGQGENMFTPLQLTSYVSTIANNGVRHNLSLVKNVSTYDGKTILNKTLPTIAEVMDVPVDDFDLVHKGMYQVTHYGTGREVFADFYVDVAGKTGTSQIGKGSENTLFISYGPYEEPEIAVVVIIEHGGFSRLNCYAAQEIYEAYYSYNGETYKSAPAGELLS